MEDTLGFWVAPLLMIPGMALLVISTANRYSQLLLHLVTNPSDSVLRRQLPLLRGALIALYLGIAVDAMAGLLGGLLIFDVVLARRLVIVLSCLGVACLVAASVALIVDASRDPLRRGE